MKLFAWTLFFFFIAVFTAWKLTPQSQSELASVLIKDISTQENIRSIDKKELDYMLVSLSLNKRP